MKKSIKKLISLALVMTMLLSTMMVVSAEGTIATEDVSFEEELMPLAATNCLYTSTRGYSGAYYRFSGTGVITLSAAGVTKSAAPNLHSDMFITEIQIMADIYENLTIAEKSRWFLIKDSFPADNAKFETWYYSEIRALDHFEYFG